MASTSRHIIELCTQAHLENYAANWLAAAMYEQLDKTGNDPTKVQLDVRLTSLRKFVNNWLMQTLKQLDTPECVPNNLRGWKESGMLDALNDDMNADHKDFKLAKELNDNGELFMDFTGKKNAKRAEEILKKHFQQHGCVSGNINSSRFQDTLHQTDAEICPVATDLLSEDENEPVVRSEQFTMEKLQQLDEWHEDEMRNTFESVNDMFPALERNGAQIRENLDWDYKDQTADIIANNTTTTK